MYTLQITFRFRGASAYAGPRDRDGECQLVGGNYRYMGDLRRLEGTTGANTSDLPRQLREIVTPLQVVEWERALSKHPDQEFAAYIINRIRNGFGVGFDRRNASRSAKRNIISAERNPEVVDKYLQKEQGASRVVSIGDADGVHVSRFGVIPKPHQPGKWRLIVDLSHPKGASINDGIDPALCSLTYMSVDEAVERAVSKGQGALLAKIDIASAYSHHPSAPPGPPSPGHGLASPVAGRHSAAILLALRAKDLQGCCGRPTVDPLSGGCGLSATLPGRLPEVCAWLGIPLAWEKLEGPACVLGFLGVELDTNRMELRLPREKLDRLIRWALERGGDDGAGVPGYPSDDGYFGCIRVVGVQRVPV